MGLFNRKKKNKPEARKTVNATPVSQHRPRFEPFSDNIDGIPTLFYDPNALHIEDIDALTDGFQFEEAAAKILKCNGFTNVKVTKRSNDYGIDVTAEREGVKYAIQCKKYSKNVGIDAVREALTGKAFYGCHVAAVMTNSHFTGQARKLAENGGVILWDREALIKMIENVKK